MKRLLLERFAYSPESTEGELFILDDEGGLTNRAGTVTPKVHVCWTLELAWKQNIPSISCIPEASYWMAPHTRPGERKSYIIWGDTVTQAQLLGRADITHKGPLPTRYGILFHAANRPEELQGCIAPGLDRKPGKLLKSALGMIALRNATKDSFATHDRMVLTIRQRITEAVI